MLEARNLNEFCRAFKTSAVASHCAVERNSKQFNAHSKILVRAILKHSVKERYERPNEARISICYIVTSFFESKNHLLFKKCNRYRQTFDFRFLCVSEEILMFSGMC